MSQIPELDSIPSRIGQLLALKKMLDQDHALVNIFISNRLTNFLSEITEKVSRAEKYMEEYTCHCDKEETQ